APGRPACASRSRSGSSGRGRGAAPRLPRHRLRCSLLHLVGRHVLDMRGHVPAVAEGILEVSGPVPVELVLDVAEGLGARVERRLKDGVDVLDIHVEGERRTPEYEATQADDARVLLRLD